MKTFKDRVAAVTGAGSGLGEALAMELAARGCHLALGDLDVQALDRVSEAARRKSVRCSVHQLDVSSRTQVETFASDVQATHGAVHMVFNNAGVAYADYVETLSYEHFERLMAINFWGVVYGTKAFLPLLRQVDQAHVINVSSLFGLGALPSQSAYNASKFAVRGFTEALKMELAGSHIGVSSVHPGGLKTNIARNSVVAEKSVQLSKADLVKRFDRLAVTTAEEAAKSILRGVQKNKRRILVGKDAWVADKLIRWFPNSYERILRLEKPLHQRFKIKR